MTTTRPIQKGQRYNRIVIAVFVVGVLSFFVGMALDRHVVGLVVYSVAGLSGVAALLYLRFASSVRLADERQQRLHNRASGAFVTLVAMVGLPTVIGLYLFDATSYYAISPFLWGAISAVGGLYLLWGAICTVYRYQS
jgi:hypothetical protein